MQGLPPGATPLGIAQDEFGRPILIMKAEAEETVSCARTWTCVLRPFSVDCRAIYCFLCPLCVVVLPIVGSARNRSSKGEHHSSEDLGSYGTNVSWSSRYTMSPRLSCVVTGVPCDFLNLDTEYLSNTYAGKVDTVHLCWPVN